jgi:AcrR family transcriptional regulator
MTTGRTYLADNRRRLRQSLVDAARALTVERGWDGVRVADVAASVGVSRQTVYNEFDNKAGLAAAVAAAEIETFLVTVRAALFEHGADIRAAGRAAIYAVLAQAAGNPLVRAILTSEHDGGGFVPYLTTDSGMLLRAAKAVLHEWAATFLPQLGEEVVGPATDAIVRLVVSHVMLPVATPGHTADTLAELFVRLLTPST